MNVLRNPSVHAATQATGNDQGMRYFLQCRPIGPALVLRQGESGASAWTEMVPGPDRGFAKPFVYRACNMGVLFYRAARTLGNALREAILWHRRPAKSV
jgi:hypothetical protein